MPVTDRSGGYVSRDYAIEATRAACQPKQTTHFTPFMLGDFTGPIANLFSDVKAAEGESPRPTDRVFYKFNYFNSLDPSKFSKVTEELKNVDMFRQSFGLEKTLLGGVMSVGLRVPFYTLDATTKDFFVTKDPNTGADVIAPGGPGFTTTHFANIAAVAKAILWEDRETGNLISAGMTMSVPTASSKKINPGMSVIAYAQPFGGFIMNQGNAFIQGFTSITLPVASAESIVMFNDIGVGYYIYRSDASAGGLTAVAPTVEMHVATPLRDANPAVDLGVLDGLKIHDVVDFTFGTTFEFGGSSTLGVGVVVPVTGPKPFDMEAIAQLNYRF